MKTKKLTRKKILFTFGGVLAALAVLAFVGLMLIYRDFADNEQITTEEVTFEEALQYFDLEPDINKVGDFSFLAEGFLDWQYHLAFDATSKDLAKVRLTYGVNANSDDIYNVEFDNDKLGYWDSSRCLYSEADAEKYDISVSGMHAGTLTFCQVDDVDGVYQVYLFGYTI